MFGNPETTPGRQRLSNSTPVSALISAGKMCSRTQPENAIGNHVKVKIVKNKGRPALFAEAEFDILYNQGINKEGSILDVGGSRAVSSTKKGAWLQFITAS